MQLGTMVKIKPLDQIQPYIDFLDHYGQSWHHSEIINNKEHMEIIRICGNWGGQSLARDSVDYIASSGLGNFRLPGYVLQPISRIRRP